MMNRQKIKNCFLTLVIGALGLGAYSSSVFAVSESAKGSIFSRYSKKRKDVEETLKNPDSPSSLDQITSAADPADPSKADDLAEANANAAQKAAAEAERKRIEAYRANQELLNRRAEEKLRAAERAAKEQADREAAQRVAAEERERNQRLVREARKAVEAGKPIPDRIIESVDDKTVQNNLIDVAVAQDLKQEQKGKEKKSNLNLAQLLQMAAVTMQAATAMNSIEGTNPAQSAQTFDPTRSDTPKAALAGRSPASLGDKKATISSKSDDPEAASAESSDEKSVKDKETLAKIKAEVEAAEKRKKILGMRLKKGLRDKLNDKLAKGQGAAAVDAESLFDGSLHQGMALANDSDQAEESAAKNSAMSASSVFRAVNQAVSDGFSLAGAETDHEVGQLVAEAERDLSSEDMSSGVLGRESPSLFQRVHSVHQACARQKCVVTQVK